MRREVQMRECADARGAVGGGQQTVVAPVAAPARLGWQSFRTHLLVLSGYLLLSIALTWPLVRYWQTAVVGTGVSFEDGSQNVWNMWWIRYAVETRMNPFWSPMLYYPDGVQLYMQTLNAPSIVMALPMNYLFGPIAAYNSAMLLAFVLTGYSGFLLVRAFVPGMVIPFICGALLTACPFHIMRFHANHLNLVSIQWLPLYFLALYRLEGWPVEAPRGQCMQPWSSAVGSWWLVVAIATFVLVTLTDWYWGLIAGVSTMIWCSIRSIYAQGRRILLQRYVVFAVGVLVFLAPLFIGIINVHETLDMTKDSATWNTYIQTYSADGLGLFFPAIFHPIWGDWMQQKLRMLVSDYGMDVWYVASGWTLLLCASLGIWYSWRTHWYLLVVGMGTWFIALGPTLRVAGFDTALPMPYAWLQHLPLVNIGRKPSHFAVVSIILAIIFAGIGLHQVSQSFSTRNRAILLASVALLAFLELWPSPRREFSTLEQPPWIWRLSTKPGAVADLPLEWKETSRSLRHQIVHEQPVLSGYVARRPDYPTVRYLPLLHQISHMRFWPDNDIVALGHNTLTAMQCYTPIRHVIVKLNETSPTHMAALQSTLTILNGGPLLPMYQDATYIWYELPLFADQCTPFLYLVDGWHNRESTEHAVWRWATTSSTIGLVNPFTQPIVVTVRLRAEALADGHPLEVWHADQVIARWEVGRAIRNYRVVVQVPPGSHPIELRSTPAHDQQADREVSLAVTEIAVDSYARWEQ